MNPHCYTNSFRKRMRILFSPLRLALFITSLLIAIVGNVIYINNGAGPEWLGPASVIPFWSCVIGVFVTDMRMRRLDRGGTTPQ
jgi:hypothetical protein